MLAITVDTLIDEADGNLLDGDVSLRDAIALAPSGETIEFSVTGTINLTLGQLSIDKTLRVHGPGAALLTIDASENDTTPFDYGGGSRVFAISDGNAGTTIEVELSGLTLTGGDVSDSGGAISNVEDLTVADSTITGNVTIGDGGAIFSASGALSLTASTLSGNLAPYGSGGGIFNRNGNLTVIGSTVHYNRATNSGGGVYSADGSLMISGTFFEQNYADGDGGGIYNRSGELVITNSTISSNRAGLNGGGIRSQDGDVLLTGGVIGDNSATYGGGIHIFGADMTLTSSAVSGNRADVGGGGIASIYGNLTITDATLRQNSAESGNGGGLYGANGIWSVIRSTISGNDASLGGGIHASSGDLTVTDTTINRNVARLSGGGIFSASDTAVLNSTISGNSAHIGAGLYLSEQIPSDFAIRHSTVTANSANGSGGGTFLASGELEVDHSILAGNFGASGSDLAGLIGSVFEPSFSLVGDNGQSGLTEAPVGAADSAGNLIGGPMNGIIDPKLGPLADHGGSTATHALLANSPALNAGDPVAVAGSGGVPEFDQRRAPFVRVDDSRIDLGAYERQAVIGLNLAVDTLTDESDGNYTTGDVSLREAIGLANGSVGLNTVTFDPILTSSGPAVILLNQGEVAIRDGLKISGPGAGQLTIDASGNDPSPDDNNGEGSRVFNIDDGVEDTFIDIEIVALTLTGGDVVRSPFAPSGFGGAIFSAENLTLANSVISGNSASHGGGVYGIGNLTISQSMISGNAAHYNGGGIFSFYGSLTVQRSSISGNSAGENGGGIYSSYAQLITEGSTVSGNSAALDGGGIFTNGALDGTRTTLIVNSTISGNAATDRGGGVFNLYGLTAIRNSTITKNTAPAGQGAGVSSVGEANAPIDVYSSIVAGNNESDVDFVDGGTNPFHSDGYNLVGSGNASGFFNAVGDQSGVANPMLAILADNGGPTMTHALLPGSAAIDAGDPSAVAGMGGVPLHDQRGAPYTRVHGGQIDIGAFELQPIGPVLPGDYNLDGVVDIADYVLWRKTLGTTGVPAFSGADGDGDGVIDQDDYVVWRAHFGQSLPPGAGAATASAQQPPASPGVGGAAGVRLSGGTDAQFEPPAEPGADGLFDNDALFGDDARQVGVALGRRVSADAVSGGTRTLAARALAEPVAPRVADLLALPPPASPGVGGAAGVRLSGATDVEPPAEPGADGLFDNDALFGDDGRDVLDAVFASLDVDASRWKA